MTERLFLRASTSHGKMQKHKNALGHVHKYESVLWTLEKLRKTIFCYKMINFSLRESKFSGNMYFSYLERLASTKVEKVLSLQKNDKKVTL